MGFGDGKFGKLYLTHDICKENQIPKQLKVPIPPPPPSVLWPCPSYRKRRDCIYLGPNLIQYKCSHNKTWVWVGGLPAT